MKSELEQLLRHREAVIADHTWRDRDPSDHLVALKSASEAITDWAKTHQASIDSKLRHYLSNASFQKALSHITQS